MNIIDVRQVNKGSLKLCFTIDFPQLGLSIKDCKLMTGPKGDWVSFPSREYQDQEGKKRFFAYVQIAEARKAEFQAKCLELLKPHLSAPAAQLPKADASLPW